MASINGDKNTFIKVWLKVIYSCIVGWLKTDQYYYLYDYLDKELSIMIICEESLSGYDGVL